MKHKDVLHVLIDGDEISSLSVALSKISSEKQTELMDILLPQYFQNIEQDHMNPVSDTRFVITQHDMINKFIVIDQEIPSDLRNYGIEWKKRWLAQGAPGDLIYISYIDFPNRRLYYSYLKGSLNVGTSVCFMNCMRTFYLDPANFTPLKSIDATWSLSGGVWKHSDGSYRLVTYDYNGAYNTLTLWRSNDLLSFSEIGGTYKYRAGVAPFNIPAWCSGGVNLVVLSGSYRIPGTNNFAKTVIAVNSSGHMVSAIVVFDENFDIVHMPDVPLTIPGYPSGANLLIIGGNIIKYQGSYLMIVNYRDYTNPFDLIWKTLIVELSDIINPAVLSVEEIIPDNIPNSFLAYAISNQYLFEWNDELYFFVTGDPHTEASLLYTPLYGNFTVGLYYKHPADGWQPYKGNPLFLTPIAAEGVYGDDVYWTSDSSGGSMTFLQKGNKVYWFQGGKSGTDSYRVGRWVLDLPDGVIWPAEYYEEE
jgi:hypothetical protein